ncbi:23319_t:CDS:2 [Gigaspora margarita]|uniref:23319_t:CDS:1 n=1 Tax=Gigaspora margarita TaxID=4874 RepID=A0ABM8W414_GIGMA|nr:23319_t:CDS:2 [Gigaspora margarita]
MNNVSDNNETISSTGTSKFKFLKPLTPQNYLLQTQVSNQFYKPILPEISNSNSQDNFENLQTLVRDNYPYIHNSDNSLLISQQKSLNELSSTQVNRRLKSLAINIKNNMQPLLLKHSNSTTSLSLEKINLQYNQDIIELKFQSIAKNIISSEHLDPIVYACEDSLISRDSLRRLAAVIPEMNREYLISQRRIEINNIMSQKISINVFTINHADNGAYRTIKSILSIIVPYLVSSKPPILVPNNVIRLKLGGDGCQVGRQQNHVLFTICILNKKELVLFPKNQHR